MPPGIHRSAGELFISLTLSLALSLSISAQPMGVGTKSGDTQSFCSVQLLYMRVIGCASSLGASLVTCAVAVAPSAVP